MPKHIAFLRAINVGGRNVKMDELRTLFESFGFSKVETFIASGNVIFENPSGDEAALVRKIECDLEKALGYEVRTFLRTDAEVAAIATYAPFSAAELASAGALNVALLAEPLKADGREALKGLETEIDAFHVHGREVYWMCKVKQSDSKFSNVVFERKLRFPTTFRTIKTFRRLATKYPPA